MKSIHQDYIRSMLFGFEDSLVSTTGVIAGVSAGSKDTKVILLAVIVTIIVEALSMGAGQFISERAVHQIDTRHADSLILGAVLMFVAYMLAGMIPLIPILVFSFPVSLYISVGAAFASLFILGYFKGKLIRVAAVRSGVEILVIGGAATALGLLAGWIFQIS